MKILVLGGTAFFDRRLVHLLLGDGNDVTIATVGQTPDDFGDAVTRIKVDRTNQDAMIEAFGNCYYDVVYNQICFILKMPKLPWNRLETALSSMSRRMGTHLFVSQVRLVASRIAGDDRNDARYFL
jgi:hypothetical protein